MISRSFRRGASSRGTRAGEEFGVEVRLGQTEVIQVQHARPRPLSAGRADRAWRSGGRGWRRSGPGARPRPAWRRRRCRLRGAGGQARLAGALDDAGLHGGMDLLAGTAVAQLLEVFAPLGVHALRVGRGTARRELQRKERCRQRAASRPATREGLEPYGGKILVDSRSWSTKGRYVSRSRRPPERRSGSNLGECYVKERVRSPPGPRTSPGPHRESVPTALAKHPQTRQARSAAPRPAAVSPTFQPANACPEPLQQRGHEGIDLLGAARDQRQGEQRIRTAKEQDEDADRQPLRMKPIRHDRDGVRRCAAARSGVVRSCPATVRRRRNGAVRFARVVRASVLTSELHSMSASSHAKAVKPKLSVSQVPNRGSKGPARLGVDRAADFVRGGHARTRCARWSSRLRPLMDNSSESDARQAHARAQIGIGQDSRVTAAFRHNAASRRRSSGRSPWTT